MKVFVIGASGQIGKHLVRLLTENGHTVLAMVRKQEQADAFESDGIATVLADLEGSVQSVAEAAKGCDAIVFTAGSGGHTGPDKTLLIDLDGAVKAMEAAESVGIKRFIIVSAIGAHIRENWNEKIKPYFVAKHYADKMIEQSNLDYTIIRPGALINEPGTGKITVKETLDRDTIAREDVARVILAVLENERTIRRSFDVVHGYTPIIEALKNI